MNFFNKLKDNPKRIFLIDAFGAMLTSILLLAVLAPLDVYFGMPLSTLYLLSGIAFSLFLYSISCHRFVKSNWKPFLAIIITCNLSYSLISFVLVIKYFHLLTQLGLIYFSIELIVIGILAAVEFKVYSNQS